MAHSDEHYQANWWHGHHRIREVRWPAAEKAASSQVRWERTEKKNNSSQSANWFCQATGNRGFVAKVWPRTLSGALRNSFVYFDLSTCSSLTFWVLWERKLHFVFNHDLNREILLFDWYELTFIRFHSPSTMACCGGGTASFFFFLVDFFFLSSRSRILLTRSGGGHVPQDEEGYFR